MAPGKQADGPVPRNILVWLSHRELPCFDITDKQIELLRARLPQAAVSVVRDQQSFLASLPEAQVAAVWRFEQDWLASARELDWILTPAAGRDYFQVETPPGLTIDYCTFHGEIIAETVCGMLLAHCRGIRETDLLSRSDPWPRRELARSMRPLRGSHVVVLGFGNIGSWIAKQLKPFGVRITGVRRNPERSLRPGFLEPADSIVPLDDLDGALSRADHVVIALPRDPSTDHLINEARLSRLRKHAVLVNVGRGNAIDERALVAALRSRSLAAAYLDVFETEPLPAESPLRDCENAFLMPHASAFSPSYLTLFVEEFAARFSARYTSE